MKVSIRASLSGLSRTCEGADVPALGRGLADGAGVDRGGHCPSTRAGMLQGGCWVAVDRHRKGEMVVDGDERRPLTQAAGPAQI